MTNKDIINATQVIDKEIAGITLMKEWLDQSFSKAIELIYNTEGHVIISGMGKSGHIAKKIAATLSSTGTPAIYIHPGEASHGDIGVINKNDVIILLSNSGETAELHDIISHAKRFSIPLIGIVRRKKSILVNSADIALILPDAEEASDVDAPTTSTTMMLVLGDAIAVSLMKRKGFTKNDFGILHPGGKLGASFTKVVNIMHKDNELPIVSDNTQMDKALFEITSKKFGCTAVINAQELFVGIITDGDIRRHMDNNFLNKTAAEIMTKNPVTIEGDQLTSEALALMQKKAITNLFILKNNKPVGIIHIHDLLRLGVV